MKNTKFGIFGFVAIAAGLMAFNNIQDGWVKGTVTPPEGALRAWVLSAKDTFKTDIIAGVFEIRDVKSGTYRLIIEAKPPYKNISKDSITVKEGNPVDVGEIALQQK
jgi:hypothetical protein